MRFFVVLIAVLALVASCTASGTQTNVKMAKSKQSVPITFNEPAVEEVMNYLMTSTATDFHAHPPVEAIRLQSVRLGHLMLSDGDMQYMLCGEFFSSKNISNTQGTPFATIKTLDYELWIGDQAVGLCKRESIIWENNNDLSPLLQSSLDALSGS